MLSTENWDDVTDDVTAVVFIVSNTVPALVFSSMVTSELPFPAGYTNSVLSPKIYIYIESLMSCHLLLNLLHELANMILCEALPSIISFLPTNVINLVINDNEFEILFIT